MAPVEASSHREAPFITEMPKVDGTDFYMFRSYETGREGYVTLIANYLPLQDGYGGPNFFELDPQARYRINIENDGAAGEDVIFEFRFLPRFQNQTLIVGGVEVAHPLRTIAPIGFDSMSNETHQYTINVIRDGGAPQRVLNASTNGPFFAKAIDNIGAKTFADYAAYANNLITGITIPDCAAGGKVFVGQRKESFAVNLGEVFDLVNLDPLGARDAKPNVLDDKNVTSIAIEVPISCLTGIGTVIGGWTTALLPRSRELLTDPTFEQPAVESGDFVQVSRLGMPLVNELVIGLADKNKFNASYPWDDITNFAAYVTNPTLPAIVQAVFGVQAPTTPRNDLVAVFVTGVSGLNQLGVGEMQRLNTSIAPTPKATQNNLGVLGGDDAGFPNGRRPGDDVVDIALRVGGGVLCHAFPGVFCTPADAPGGLLPLTDQTLQDASQFDSVFPYLTTPLPGSPNTE
jgi:hypothetical protein